MRVFRSLRPRASSVSHLRQHGLGGISQQRFISQQAESLFQEGQKHLSSDLDKASGVLYESLRLQLKESEVVDERAFETLDQLIALHLAAAMESGSDSARRKELEGASRLYDALENLKRKQGDFEGLAKIFMRKGRHLGSFSETATEAEASFEASLALISEHNLANGDAVKMDLARFLQSCDKDDDRVRQLYGEILESSEDEMSRIQVSTALASFLLSKQEFEEAEGHIIRALEPLRKALKAEDGFLIHAESLLVHTLSMLARHEEAGEKAMRIVATVQSMPESEMSADVADSLLACAIALDLNSDPDAALEVLEKAKEILVAEEHPTTAVEQLIETIRERKRNSAGLGKILDE